MEKFIRVDTIGQWRDTEHRSFIGGDCYDDKMSEKGISCYNLENIVEGIENLYHYWFKFCLADVSSFEGSQITIFEGEHTGEYGYDKEDLATCNKTLIEIPAHDIFSKIYEAYERLNCEEINEQEYKEILNGLEL